MAELNIPKIRVGKTDKETIQNLMDAYEMLRKQLEFLIQNIDSDNVTEINTNITRVKSNQGTTEIKGPLLLMFDLGKHLRRKEGLDTSTGLFTDEWYDEAGNRTAYIDSAGKLVVVDGYFTGSITGSTITGGTVRTAAPGNDRIELKADGMISYNEMNQKEGVAIEAGLYGFSKLAIYVAGVLKGGISAGTANALFLESASGNNLHIASGNSGSSDDYISGFWNCSLSRFSYLRDEIGDFYATRGWVNSQGFITGVSGASGSFETADGKTVTVSNGLITSIT